MTPTRVAGLLIGFLGVVLLVGRDVEPSDVQGSLIGHLAVIFAAFLYAVSGIFARRYLSRISYVVQAFVPLFAADIVVWILALTWETPFVLPTQSITWIALMWMGFLGSSAAYLIFYALLNTIGPTRVSLVTYTIALVGVVLGIVFLEEQLDVRLAVGASMVVLGVAVVNRRSKAVQSKDAIKPA
jgi:drug/metabolite transporter (DMT)-like permease